MNDTYTAIKYENLYYSAVHFLSVFTTNSTLVGSISGTTIASPTDTTPVDENVTIQVSEGERAFDIGFGRQYDLFNETTDTVVNSSLTALNTLLSEKEIFVRRRKPNPPLFSSSF